MKRPANHLLGAHRQAVASRALRVFQLAQLRLGLELELNGIPFARQGPSASALTRRLLGLEGRPAELLQEVDALLESLGPRAPSPRRVRLEGRRP